MKYLFMLLFAFTSVFPRNRQLQDSVKSHSNKPEIKLKLLPFSFFDNSVGLVFGGLGEVKGLAQQETFAKIGGIVSTSGTYYGFLQLENFQVPFFTCLFLRPDFYVGKVKDVKLYLNKPKNEFSSPGANESEENDYASMEGYDRWYEFNIKYLLPFGHGKEQTIINPVFKNGLLVSGETGGTSWNPFKSGRSFIESKFFYRNIDLHSGRILYKSETLGVEFALSHENMDYFFNPTTGSYKRISYSVDWGSADKKSQFNSFKLDYRWYFPLYDKSSDALPCVLALNLVTMDTPSWYDYDLVTTTAGNQIKVFHRPQLFASANLGGEKRLRSYPRFRFYDKAMIYYSAELRKDIGWNPFDSLPLTRDAGIDFIQLVAFADIGRVAPQWNLKTFHRHMKWSVGGGMRLLMDGMVVRVDVAGGHEGVLTQMFIDHAF